MVTFVFNAEEKPGCRDIELTDLTGIYDHDNNPTGWDNGTGSSPNFKISDVAVITVIFTFSDGSTKQMTIPTGGRFPGIGNNTKVTITSEDLGFADGSKPDGLTNIRVILTCTQFHGGSAFPIPILIEASYDFLWTCQAWCCVANLASRIPKGKSGCTDCKHKKLFEIAYSLLLQAELAANCGNFTGAVELLTEVQTICTTNNCNCS